MSGTDIVCFIVLGEPFGKQRPRHNRCTSSK